MNAAEKVRGVPPFEWGPWRGQAACFGRDDIEWFPQPPRISGGVIPPAYLNAVAAAKAVCAPCPVLSDCLTAALATDEFSDYGIRGGTTAAERKQIRSGGLPKKGRF